MAKEFSFSDLNKEMSKISEYGDTLDKSTISEIDHYIPTGNFHLKHILYLMQLSKHNYKVIVLYFMILKTQ